MKIDFIILDSNWSLGPTSTLSSMEISVFACPKVADKEILDQI